MNTQLYLGNTLVSISRLLHPFYPFPVAARTGVHILPFNNLQMTLSVTGPMLCCCTFRCSDGFIHFRGYTGRESAFVQSKHVGAVACMNTSTYHT